MTVVFAGALEEEESAAVPPSVLFRWSRLPLADVLAPVDVVRCFTLLAAGILPDAEDPSCYDAAHDEPEQNAS